MLLKQTEITETQNTNKTALYLHQPCKINQDKLQELYKTIHFWKLYIKGNITKSASHIQFDSNHTENIFNPPLELLVSKAKGKVRDLSCAHNLLFS